MFLGLYLKAAGASQGTTLIVHYYAEKALVDFAMLAQFLPP